MVAEDDNEMPAPVSGVQDPLPTNHPKLEAFQSAVTQVLLRRIAEAEVKIGQLRKEKEAKGKEREERTKVSITRTVCLCTLLYFTLSLAPVQARTC